MRRPRPAALLLLAPLLLAGCHGAATGRPDPSPPPTGAVTVGRTASDPVTGSTLTVERVDRDGADLLVQLSAGAGTRFATGVTPTALTVETAAGHVVAATTPPAAFTAFVGAQPGRRTTGWLAFRTPPAAGAVLRLTRAAFTVVGSQQTVPAAAYPVPLPAV